MFNVGGGEIIVVLLLALLLLGPDRLPQAARKVGRVLHELRRMTSGFEEEMRKAIDVDLGNGTRDQALDRTTEGPTLVPPTTTAAPTPPRPTPTTMGPSPFVGDLSAPTDGASDA